MNYRVVVQPRAQADVARIFDWLSERSSAGAVRWFEEWLRVVEMLSHSPQIYGLAPESDAISHEVRQALFRTRRGRRFRVLFTIQDQVVDVLHVRGSGQPPLDLR